MAEFVRHVSCPHCGSRDAGAEYSDGSFYCFKCNVDEQPKGSVTQDSTPKRATASGAFLEGDIRPIKTRHLTLETCQKFGYRVGKFHGRDCHIAPYYDAAGTLVAQKIRTTDKSSMPIIGDFKKALLFGQHGNKDHGKRVIVTEGELDAMSVSQALGNSWPVVSVKNGAGGAKKDLSGQLEWLEGFDEIVLFFDNDEPGKKATEECVQLFSPGKAKVAALREFKDASDALVAGKVADISQAVWNAKVYRPDGVRSLKDVAQEAKAPIEVGLPLYIQRLTELTYGRRLGEVWVLGGGTGCGKTDLISEQVAFDVMTLQEKVGLFFFEQQNFETARRIAGKVASKAFHIPGAGWSQKDLDKTVDDIADTNRVFLYNHFGQTDWEVVRSRMRFMAITEGVKLFYLDNLSSLADPGNERESLETLMAEVVSLAQELKVWVLIVSHLATPEGKPHEEGGHVALRHFKGARAISHWAFFAFGLERNKVAEIPEERLRARLVCLKDRYTGRADGESVDLVYDQESCRLREYTGHTPTPTPEEFRDETLPPHDPLTGEILREGEPYEDALLERLRENSGEDLLA